jgi:protein TonB
MLLGFYRTNVRSEQEMGPEDSALFAELLNAPRALFIIIQQVLDSQTLAQISYRDGHLVRTLPQRFEVKSAVAGPMPQIPASSPRSLSGSAEAPPAFSPLPSIPSTAARTITPLQSPATEKPSYPSIPARPLYKRVLLPLAVGLAAAILGAVCFSSYQAREDRKPSAANSPFGLDADKREDHVLLKWNTSAPALLAARSAQLIVRDSQQERKLELSYKTLSSGRLLYITGGGDLELTLEVDGPDGRRVSESVTFVASPLSNSLHVDASVTPQRSAPHNAAQGEASGTVPQASRTFVPPSPAKPAEEKATTPLDIPPEVALVPSAQQPIVPSQPIFAPPSAPPAVAPGVPLPDSEAALVPSVALVPASGSNDKSFSLAQPVRRVAPVIPANVRTMMHGSAQVQVNVSIEANGLVTDAKLVSATGSMANILAPLALNAAKRWQFTPAQSNGHPLPSQQIIVFGFSGK